MLLDAAVVEVAAAAEAAEAEAAEDEASLGPFVDDAASACGCCSCGGVGCGLSLLKSFPFGGMTYQSLSSRMNAVHSLRVLLFPFFQAIFILIGNCFVLKVPFLDASRISQY